MATTDLLILVKSLSGPEKRAFKLHCKKQSGAKDYLDLFDVINQIPLGNDINFIEHNFKKKHPQKNLENTGQYLLKLITDSLVNTRKEKDKWFQQYHSLMRSRILIERSIPQEAYKELRKVQKLSVELQDNLIFYYTSCREMKYWSDMGFGEKSENEIVQNFKPHICAPSQSIIIRAINRRAWKSTTFDRRINSSNLFSSAAAGRLFVKRSSAQNLFGTGRHIKK